MLRGALVSHYRPPVCRSGNFTEACMLLKQALNLNPAHPPALLEQKLVDEASKSAVSSAT
jgi:hypothetical protein